MDRSEIRETQRAARALNNGKVDITEPVDAIEATRKLSILLGGVGQGMIALAISTYSMGWAFAKFRQTYKNLKG